MSELMNANRAYRRTYALAKTRIRAYNECWVTECCVECDAPEDIVAAYLYAHREAQLMLDGLEDFCGYTKDDLIAFNKDWESELYLPADVQEAWMARMDIFFEYDIINMRNLNKLMRRNK